MKGDPSPLPGNAKAVVVKAVGSNNGGGYTITQTHDVQVDFWRDMTKWSIIKPSILEQNKQHLAQRCCADGLCTEPAIVALEKRFGMNEHVEAMFDETYAPEGATNAMMTYF